MKRDLERARRYAERANATAQRVEVLGTRLYHLRQEERRLQNAVFENLPPGYVVRMGRDENGVDVLAVVPSTVARDADSGYTVANHREDEA